MNPYDEGRAAFAAGTELTANPYTGADDQAKFDAWKAGWEDARAEADQTTAPTETEGGGSNEPATTTGTEATAPAVQPTETLETIGEQGYERILDLLSNPPFDDEGTPTPGWPLNGEIPEDLDEWLKAFKAPLVGMALGTAVSGVRSFVAGNQASRGRLKELYRGMTPGEMSAAMNANADAIAKLADKRVSEAGLIVSLQQKVTQKAAGFLLSALLV